MANNSTLQKAYKPNYTQTNRGNRERNREGNGARKERRSVTAKHANHLTPKPSKYPHSSYIYIGRRLFFYAKNVYW